MGPSPAATSRLRAAAPTAATSRRSSTAGRAATTSSRCGGCCGRCCERGGLARRLLRRPATTRRRADVARRLEAFTRAPSRWTCASVRARARAAAASPTSSRGRRGQRLQAPQPVPALDGAAGRRRPRWLDAGIASRLIVPLDTHTIRVGRCLRLTRYTSPGWRMAADITAHAARRSTRRSGPVRLLALPHRHDGRCGFGEKRGSGQCPLKGVCRPKARLTGS